MEISETTMQSFLDVTEIIVNSDVNWSDEIIIPPQPQTLPQIENAKDSLPVHYPFLVLPPLSKPKSISALHVENLFSNTVIVGLQSVAFFIQ